MEAYRNYIDFRLQEAAEDVAYAADTGPAFEEVRRLYAEHYYLGHPATPAYWHRWTPP